jgi:general secretion pathway protein G
VTAAPFSSIVAWKDLFRGEGGMRVSDRRRRERGLTLVEMLVVLLIIGLIASFAVPQVMTYVGGARRDAAAVQVKRLGGILDLYRLDVGAYPTTEQGLDALLREPRGATRWNGPYLQQPDALTDPWGRPYEYRAPGEHGAYDLYSLGADGRPGGEGENADATSW